VRHRDANGPFRTRRDLLKVPRLGEKAFEQAAGFLRIPHGDDPLDASAVHPEAYPVVHKIVAESGRDVRAVIGDSAFLRALQPERFTDARFGLPTVRDILKELEKPGRDPREVVKAGDVVKVKVLEVDLARRRIALTMRLDDTPGEQRGALRGEARRDAPPVRQAARVAAAAPPAHNALAEALARARRN
jgi:transcriptional accessory protein Tex/SPT6